MFTRKRKRVRVTPKGVTRTQQHFKVHQDVNNIVARCMRGDMSGLKSHGINDDVSNLPDNLHDLLIQRSENSNFLESVFDKIPEDVRKIYKTPSEFLSALSDEGNRPVFERFGIFKKKNATSVPVTSSPDNSSPSTEG